MMRLSDFERYQRENPFMDYNHIEIVFVESERSQVRMAITPSGRNLNGLFMAGCSIRWLTVWRVLLQGRMAGTM